MAKESTLGTFVNGLSSKGRPASQPLGPILLALVNAMGPASKAMLDSLGNDPKYAPILNAAKAHPRTVEVSTPGPRGNPESTPLPSELQGQWQMYPDGNDKIRTSPGTQKDVMAHELSHFLLGNSKSGVGMSGVQQEIVAQKMGDYGSGLPQADPTLKELYKLLVGEEPASSGGIARDSSGFYRNK